MDPAGFARHRRSGVLFGAAVVGDAGIGDPRDFCSHGSAVGEGVEDAVADVGGAADAVEEFGLQQARDAEGGGGEGDAEGGVGPDEEVLG